MVGAISVERPNQLLRMIATTWDNFLIVPAGNNVDSRKSNIEKRRMKFLSRTEFIKLFFFNMKILVPNFWYLVNTSIDIIELLNDTTCNFLVLFF